MGREGQHRPSLDPSITEHGQLKAPSLLKPSHMITVKEREASCYSSGSQVFQKHWCLGPTPRDSDLTGLVCSLGSQVLNPQGDVHMQPELPTTVLWYEVFCWLTNGIQWGIYQKPVGKGHEGFVVVYVFWIQSGNVYTEWLKNWLWNLADGLKIWFYF